MSDPQIIPQPQIITNLSKTGINKSGPSNSPRMIISEFDVDELKYSFLKTQSGAKSIRIREDLLSPMREIKVHLNSHHIPLSCHSFNVSVDNDSISDLARVGLEVHLNSYGALTSIKNPDYSDYYVAPDPLIKNKLRVYGCAGRNLDYVNATYKPVKQILDVYDIRETYGKMPPKLIRIYKPLLDITQIFEDYGFISKQPDKDWLLTSDNIKSNWFIFFKPSKINIGYTYKELLSTVYANNGESVWIAEDRKWDGKKFTC